LTCFLGKTLIPRPEQRGPSPDPLCSGRGTGHSPLRLDFRASISHYIHMVAPLTTQKPLFAATTRKAISYPSYARVRDKVWKVVTGNEE
jgi:hypothetical protein